MKRETERKHNVIIATNNGDVGGGEVMLLNIAHALRHEGVDVCVVGPSEPANLINQAREQSLRTVVLNAKNRLQWMWALRRWDSRHREGILWCNGLVPAVATMGHRNRIVHLHQEPKGILRLLARPARWNTLVTLVPSESMANAISGATVLYNWVTQVEVEKPTRAPSSPMVVGFLGRPSLDKGVDVLARAISILEAERPGEYRLLIAGEPRFVSPEQRQAVEDALRPISQVTDLPGWMKPGEFFSQVDLLICPSVWPESFGLVVAEAMSANVPIILSDAGALPELVGKDYDYLVPAGNAQALAEKILQWSQHKDPHVQAEMFTRWDTLFSPERGQQAVTQLLSTLPVRD